MAEQGNVPEQGHVPDETQEHNEKARRAFERMKSLSVGMGAREAGRAACRLSKWANPTYMQWKDVNRAVTTDMVKTIWPCTDAETKKGRWKISKCDNEDIKQHAERIFLEVFGHPLHNADSPLYFAKMLYMQFIMNRPVDFGSKEINHITHDIREDSVTFTREDLQLIVEGAELELSQVKEQLTKKLEDKEQEAIRLTQIAQTPPQAQGKVEAQLQQLNENVQGLTQRIHPGAVRGSHIINYVYHPDMFRYDESSSSTDAVLCPACNKLFDSWSGYYTLPCNHYFHLACLVRIMVNGTACNLCNVEIPEGLYSIFGMSSDYKGVRARQPTPTVLRNLFPEEQAGPSNNPM